MLNCQGIANYAAKEISEDMVERMMDKNYCINEAVIKINVEKKLMTVETTRLNGIGIEFNSEIVTDLSKITPVVYNVIAGKYSQDEGPNCKMAEQYGSLDEAMSALEKLRGYHWSYIEYKGKLLDLNGTNKEFFS